jgi:hypothetical protein
MGIGLGATVYLPTFAPRRVTHSATLPDMDGINAVLLRYRLQGSETRRLKVSTEPFFFSCLRNSVSIQAQMTSCGFKLERHVFNLSVFLLAKPIGTRLNQARNQTLSWELQKILCMCSTYPCFPLPKPFGTRLNQARNQALSWRTPSNTAHTKLWNQSEPP